MTKGEHSLEWSEDDNQWFPIDGDCEDYFIISDTLDDDTLDTTDDLPF